MKRKHLKRASRLAVGLAREVAARLPGNCAVPLEDVFEAVWPLAVRLERLERRARRDRRKAKAHRKLASSACAGLEAAIGPPFGGRRLIGARDLDAVHTAPSHYRLPRAGCRPVWRKPRHLKESGTWGAAASGRR